jgi:hypothetical protein
MKTCDKCKITINTSYEYCPLCHQSLQGEVEKNFIELYPKSQNHIRKILPNTKKVIFFTTVVTIIILIITNLLFRNDTIWSLLPIVSIIWFWLLIRLGVFSRTSVAFKMAGITVILISLIVFVNLNKFSENLWSINYVMPALLTVCNLAIFTVMWIRRLNYREYLFHLTIVFALSIVPIVLYLVNVIESPLPSIITFGISLLIILFIAIFFPKAIKEEIKKMFHI